MATRSSVVVQEGVPVRESDVNNVAFKIIYMGATLNPLYIAQHMGTNLKCKAPIRDGKIGVCFKSKHEIPNVARPKPHVWWFCATDVARCAGSKVPNYVKKKPPIPDVWPMMQGTNLTQEEVDALTTASFRIVARPDAIDEESLFPQEGPIARQEPPIMTTSQWPSRRWNCVVRERRIVAREQKHSMVRARALQVVHKGHFHVGTLGDSWVYTV
jgi:hypothetical protein